MPELRTEIAEYHGQPRECRALVLDSGAKLLLLTTTREMEDIFVYSDEKYSFNVMAYRWSEKVEVLDAWTVFLGRGLQALPGSVQDQLSEYELHRVKDNIAAVLRAWPRGKLEAAVPLKGVIFRMTEWRNRPDEMIEF
jgi:hypothetical protein